MPIFEDRITGTLTTGNPNLNKGAGPSGSYVVALTYSGTNGVMIRITAGSWSGPIVLQQSSDNVNWTTIALSQIQNVATSDNLGFVTQTGVWNCVLSGSGYVRVAGGQNFQGSASLDLQVLGGPNLLGIVAAYGTATLSSGSATVTNANVTATSVIFLAALTLGGTPGALYISAKTVGTSFVISSTSGSDGSVVEWAALQW